MDLKDGLHLRFKAKTFTYVDGAVSGVSPLSSVTVCDNDGATYQKVPVGADGVFDVDFVLAPREAPHVVAGLTDRLKFHFHGRGDLARNGNKNFQFGVAAESVYLGDVLARNCTANGVAPVTRPATQSKLAPAKGPLLFRHNFSKNEVHVQLLPCLEATPQAVLSRFEALVEAGAVRESVLWRSGKFNQLIGAHGERIKGEIQTALSIDVERGLGSFAGMQSAFPMFGEALLYPDISRATACMRQEYCPHVAGLYSVFVGFNLNNVHPIDVEHLSDHSLAYILADCLTFFTVDNIAGAYVSDETFGDIVPEAERKQEERGREAWQGRIKMQPTECISRSFSEPNIDWRVFSANDCEDHTNTIIGVAKGYVELHSLLEADEAAFDGKLNNPLFAAVDAEAKSAVKVFLRRAHCLLTPFLARLKGGEPTGEGARVDISNVLGTALGASTDNVTGSYGGHSYAHMAFFPGAGSGARPECIVLEGTARLQNLEIAPREQVVPVLREVDPDMVPLMVRQGFRPVGATAAGTVAMEIDLLATDLAAAVEGSVKWLEVDPRTQARRTIPWMTLSKRSARTHEHDFAARPDALQEAMERKAETCFYQDAVVMGNKIVSETLPASRSERLGTFFPSYRPGDPCVRFAEPSAEKSGLDPETFAQMQQYKLDRLCEIFEPLVAQSLDEQITDHWKPVACVAKPRGEAVNDYMASVYCVTVSEASLDPAEQQAQRAKALSLTSQGAATLAKEGLPHEIICHEGIHSVMRTMVYHKPTVAEKLAPGPAQVGSAAAPRKQPGKAGRKAAPRSKQATKRPGADGTG